MENSQDKSVYIHIPFCDTICNYCDFCKFIKNDEWILRYLNELEREIKLKYKGERVMRSYEIFEKLNLDYTPVAVKFAMTRPENLPLLDKKLVE